MLSANMNSDNSPDWVSHFRPILVLIAPWLDRYLLLSAKHVLWGFGRRYSWVDRWRCRCAWFRKLASRVSTPRLSSGLLITGGKQIKDGLSLLGHLWHNLCTPGVKLLKQVLSCEELLVLTLFNQVSISEIFLLWDFTAFSWINARCFWFHSMVSHIS